MLSHVSLVMLDQMLLSSIAMPLEMLQAAITYERLQRRLRHPVVVQTVSLDEKVTGLGGLSLDRDAAPDEITRTDLILLPALWRNPQRALGDDQRLEQWLRAMADQGALIMAIGTGVWLPARAGLLDHQAATTHWHALDAFAEQFPQVKLQRDHLLTQSGRIYCAASINSGADMMIHLIGLYFGAATAHFVEQQFSPEVRNPFEKRVFREEAAQHADEAMALAQGWLHQHWQEPLALERLASIAGLSERQTLRRFRLATGDTPGQYLQKLRCRYARDWLQNSDLPVSDIAQLCGFADSSHFGRVFRSQAGVSPGQYRRQVRSKLFSPDQTKV